MSSRRETAEALTECYSPKHTLTRMEDRKDRPHMGGKEQRIRVKPFVTYRWQ